MGGCSQACAVRETRPARHCGHPPPRLPRTERQVDPRTARRLAVGHVQSHGLHRLLAVADGGHKTKDASCNRPCVSSRPTPASAHHLCALIWVCGLLRYVSSGLCSRAVCLPCCIVIIFWLLSCSAHVPRLPCFCTLSRTSALSLFPPSPEHLPLCPLPSALYPLPSALSPIPHLPYLSITLHDILRRTLYPNAYTVLTYARPLRLLYEYMTPYPLLVPRVRNTLRPGT